MELTTELMNVYFDACAQSQSDYAIEHFVEGSALTPERRFRQAVIELDAAQRALRNAEYELEKLYVDKDETSYDIERSRDAFNRRRSEI